MKRDKEQFEFLHPLVHGFQTVGFEIFLVGGSVRDYVLGQKVKDFDLCTNARPESVRTILEMKGANIIEKNGGNFGTVHCIWDGRDVEITTYRLDKKYETGSRRPEVEFADNLEDDLIRRDFTMNAMTMDVFGNINWDSPMTKMGYDDLMHNVLKAPRDPNVMFREDPLRILRMYRFAHRFNMKVDRKLRQAARNYAPHLKHVSMERIQEEFKKICDGNNPHEAIREMVSDGVMERVMYGVHRFLGHASPHDASRGMWRPTLEHMMAVVEHVSENGGNYQAVLATLFMLGDGVVSRDMGELKFSNADLKAVETMSKMARNYLGLSWGEGWEESEVRQFVTNCKGFHNEVLMIMKGDKLAREGNVLPGVDDLEAAVAAMSQETIEFLVDPKPPLNGEEVKEMLNIKDGPFLGSILKELKQMAIDGQITTKERATEWLLNGGVPGIQNEGSIH